MRKTVPGIVLVLFIAVSPLVHGSEGDQIFLERIDIQGNRITKEAYIRNMLTLREGRPYDIDEVVDEINRSREKLERSGLFTNIFFNDELDELNNLVLTVQLRENNYFHFGPSGYIGYQKGELYSVLSLYGRYTNLFGNSSFLDLEAPFYRDYGIIARVSNFAPDSFGYVLGFDARYDHFFDEYVQKAVMGLGYSFGYRFLLATDVHVNRESPRNADESTTSIVFFPHLRWGYDRRLHEKQRSWYSLLIKPYLGVNVEAETVGDRRTFGGIESRLSVYRDIVLRMVYSAHLYASYQDGGVPNEYALHANVRGSNYDAYGGSYFLSLTNGVDFPWPWNSRIHLVPFLDSGIIGDDEATFLIGGGLGLHWYTRYQDPLVFELAYGRGLMLNLTKRF